MRCDKDAQSARSDGDHPIGHAAHAGLRPRAPARAWRACVARAASRELDAPTSVPRGAGPGAQRCSAEIFCGSCCVAAGAPPPQQQQHQHRVSAIASLTSLLHALVSSLSGSDRYRSCPSQTALELATAFECHPAVSMRVCRCSRAECLVRRVGAVATGCWVSQRWTPALNCCRPPRMEHFSPFALGIATASVHY